MKINDYINGMLNIGAKKIFSYGATISSAALVPSCIHHCLKVSGSDLENAACDAGFLPAATSGPANLTFHRLNNTCELNEPVENREVPRQLGEQVNHILREGSNYLVRVHGMSDVTFWTENILGDIASHTQQQGACNGLIINHVPWGKAIIFVEGYVPAGTDMHGQPIYHLNTLAELVDTTHADIRFEE